MNVCSKCGVFVLSLEHEAKFSDMDKVQKQRGSIVLHKETRDGADYIRIEYANSQAVAQLLAQDTDDTDNMWNIISSCYSIDVSTDKGEFQL